jgi:hypothetical protein
MGSIDTEGQLAASGEFRHLRKRYVDRRAWVLGAESEGSKQYGWVTAHQPQPDGVAAPNVVFRLESGAVVSRSQFDRGRTWDFAD